jgi:Uncharacterized conserved protein
MAENNFSSSLDALFKGMNNFITTKTVVGEAINLGETVILPLVDVSFGVGAGALSGEKKNNLGGGMGGKISPSCILVIQDGVPKLVNIKNQDALTKVLDMAPDLLNKFAEGRKKKEEEEVLSDIAKEVKEKE